MTRRRPRTVRKTAGKAKAIRGLQRAPSALEALLALQLRSAGITGYTREYKFAAGRRWRFDFAFVNPWKHRLAIECEGGTWSRGRHTTGSGFAADCDKYNAAMLLGWRVLRYTGEQIRSGQALAQIEQALEP